MPVRQRGRSPPEPREQLDVQGPEVLLPHQRPEALQVPIRHRQDGPDRGLHLGLGHRADGPKLEDVGKPVLGAAHGQAHVALPALQPPGLGRHLEHTADVQHHARHRHVSTV